MLLAILFALWLALFLLSVVTRIIAIAWLGYGLWLVANSKPRRVYADILFILLWPYHQVRRWMGLE